MLSTIALEQSGGEKSTVTVTLAKGSCNKTAISLGSAGPAVPRSAVPQIHGLTPEKPCQTLLRI